MARSQASFAKKEKEKQKLQKRKDKEQRKEDRKASAKEGQTLEEMMAYVDENGNITSTPPDPTKKHGVSVGDIVIGSRNNNDGSNVKQNTERTGKVTFFNKSKGFGFIKDDQTQESVFVHANSLTFVLQENDRVSFESQKGPKGPMAVNVRKK
jgi:cold shock CspA family protein